MMDYCQTVKNATGWEIVELSSGIRVGVSDKFFKADDLTDLLNSGSGFQGHTPMSMFATPVRIR